MDVIATINTIDVPVAARVATYRSDGSRSVRTASVQSERTLQVVVNDRPVMRLGCSEGSLVELVVGRLFTEGLIDGLDDIDCLSVCDKALRADVYLMDRSRTFAAASVDEVPTCCTMNRVLATRPGTRELRPIEPRAWDPAWIFAMARAFAGDSPQHRRTRGTHSCYVAREGEVLFSCEDIGRHNALDKAIGRLLVEGIDAGECMLFTSGRVPTDMAVKAIRAGVPLLASKAAVTDRAVELARAWGLTLVGAATPESFDVLCDPWNEVRHPACAADVEPVIGVPRARWSA